MPGVSKPAESERFCPQSRPPWSRPRVAASLLGAALWSLAGYGAAQLLFARSESGVPSWWWVAHAIPTAALLLLALYFRFTEKPDPNRHTYNPYNLYSAPSTSTHEKSCLGQDRE